MLNQTKNRQNKTEKKSKTQNTYKDSKLVVSQYLTQYAMVIFVSRKNREFPNVSEGRHMNMVLFGRSNKHFTLIK